MARKKDNENTAPRPFPLATAFLCLSLALSFLAFSSGGIFASEDNISKYQLSVDSSHNIIFYVFQHTGYSHLIGNVAVILAAGAIVERRIGKRDALGVFFGASVFAGAIFALINTDYSIVGASAGGIALLTAAITLDPRKTIVWFALAIAVGYAMIFGMNYYVEAQKQQLTAEAKALGEVKEKALESKDAALVEETERKISERHEALGQISEGERLRETQPSFEIHFFAALFSFAYLIAFRRKEVMESLATHWAPLFRLLRID